MQAIDSEDTPGPESHPAPSWGTLPALFSLSALTAFLAILLTILMTAGCNSNSSLAALAGDAATGPVGALPPGDLPVPFPTPTGGGTRPPAGPACQTADPNHICLAVNYTVYLDPTNVPILSQQDAFNNIRGVNGVWATCNIGFEVEKYSAVRAPDYGLAYQTSNLSELDDIRAAFGDDSTLLVASTGTWDRTGTLGTSRANAWTAMPGAPPYGAVLERPVSMYVNMIAHELGHYLNLAHVSNTSDLMNPIVYSNSTSLDPSQCSTARSAVTWFWQKMVR